MKKLSVFLTLTILLIATAATTLQPAKEQTVTATISVGIEPWGIAFTPNGAYAYVANFGSNTVMVIDTATNGVIKTIQVKESPMAVAVTPDGEYAYVTNALGFVTIISTESNTVSTTISVGSEPYGIAITPNGQYAYVTNGPNLVSVINIATKTVVATVQVGESPYDVAITPDGKYAYVSTYANGGTVYVINTATNSVAATIPVGSNPYGVAITPNGKTAYVTNLNSGTVSVISTATNTVTNTITVAVDSNPADIAITPDGAYAYVTSLLNNGAVYIINTATNTVTSKLSGLYEPQGIAITPNGEYAYVSNYGVGSVSVISTLTVNISSSSPTLDVGQSTTFTATASGGSDTYPSYQWYVDGNAQSGQTASTFNYSPTSPGTYSVTAKVTDSNAVTSSASNAVSVTVNPALVNLSIYALSTKIDQGQSSTIVSTGLSGGTTPYSYQWLQKAPGMSSYTQIPGAASSSYTFATTDSTASGVWSFELQVVDSATSPVTVTSYTSVTVNVAPTVSITPSTVNMDVGQSKTFTASASGGSESYIRYQWYMNGLAQAGQTGQVFSFTPSSTGLFLITATVTDSLETTSPQSTAASVTVNGVLGISAPSASPNTLVQGETAVLTCSSATSGTSPYIYQWYEKAPESQSYSPIDGATSLSYTFVTSASTAAGNWGFMIKVTDGSGATVDSTAVTLTVTPLSSPTSSPTPSPTVTSTPSESPTVTPTPPPTVTSAPTESPTVTPSSTTTPTPVPTSTASTSTSTTSPTSTPKTTASPSPKPTLTPSVAPTVSQTPNENANTQNGPASNTEMIIVLALVVAIIVSSAVVFLFIKFKNKR